MSLNTVLKIGKVLRSSEDNIKYFRYANHLPINNNADDPICLSILVDEDYSFRWDEIERVPQNQMENLYYLKYKVSDQDTSSAKYVFGDIFYSRKKVFKKNNQISATEEKGGNYIIDKTNAFEVAKGIRNSIIKMIVELDSERISKNDKILVEELCKVIEGHDERLSMLNQSKYDIIKYWHSFFVNKERLETCLKYGPVISKSNINDKEKIVDDYCKYLLDEKKKNLPKSYKDCRDYRSLSKEQKNQITQYADHSVFIHFNFNSQHWYKLNNILDFVIDSLNADAIDKQKFNLLVPAKSIYRTLCSGDDKNDIQFPLFEYKNSYKSFAFKNKEIFYPLAELKR